MKDSSRNRRIPWRDIGGWIWGTSFWAVLSYGVGKIFNPLAGFALFVLMMLILISGEVQGWREERPRRSKRAFLGVSALAGLLIWWAVMLARFNGGTGVSGSLVLATNDIAASLGQAILPGLGGLHTLFDFAVYCLYFVFLGALVTIGANAVSDTRSSLRFRRARAAGMTIDLR